MNVRVRLVVLLTGLLLGAGARPGAAADAAFAKKVEALNAQAIVAYRGGDNEGARQKLLDAVVLAKEHGLGAHAVVARSYLNLGLVHVEGLKDEERGQRYFAGALRIDPRIDLKPGLASEAVTRVFALARRADGGAGAQPARGQGGREGEGARGGARRRQGEEGPRGGEQNPPRRREDAQS